MTELILTDLRHFLLLAAELHFGRTAEQIGVAQPVLTRRIRRLEDAVGAKLLDRTSRSVALTPEGRRLRESGAAALLALDTAIGSVRQALAHDHSPLRVGFFAAAERILPAIVSHWRDRLGLDVQLFHLHSAQQVRQLRDGTLDIGFLRPPSALGSLTIRTLWHDSVVCVMPLGHPLARHDSISLRQLAGECLVRFSPMIGIAFQRRIEGELRRRGIAFTPGQAVQNTHSVQSLVAMAEGVALLPGYVADMPKPGLAYVPVEDLPKFIPLAVACKSGPARRDVERAMDAVTPVGRLPALR